MTVVLALPGSPGLPVLPVLPRSPAGPAGPGTPTTVGGVATTTGRSQALWMSAAIRAAASRVVVNFMNVSSGKDVGMTNGTGT